MNFEVDDIKVLGAIEGGAKTIKAIMETSKVDKKQLELILVIFEESGLIKSVEGKGIWGDRKFFFSPTDAGSKKVNEYIAELNEKWKRIIQFVTDGERDQLDEYMKQNKYLANMMLYFNIINLPAISRLNLRFLIEGEHLCYKCKKELGKYSNKFTVPDCRKRGLKVPKGLTTHDDLCADCFDGLAVR